MKKLTWFKINRKRRLDSSSIEERILLESAEIASSKAQRVSTVLGITIKVIRGNEILEINPDNSIKVIKSISRPKLDTTGLTKGMILVRK
jgi:hypothetical protein